MSEGLLIGFWEVNIFTRIPLTVWNRLVVGQRIDMFCAIVDSSEELVKVGRV